MERAANGRERLGSGLVSRRQESWEFGELVWDYTEFSSTMLAEMVVSGLGFFKRATLIEGSVRAFSRILEGMRKSTPVPKLSPTY